MRAATRYLVRGAVILAIAASAVPSACKPSGSATGTESIALALTPTSATVQQGGSTTVTATITSSGGFGGAVSVDVQAPPSGISASVGSSSTLGAATTVPVGITVAATVAAGTYPLTLRATGNGVAAVTMTFTLMVTTAQSGGAFSITPQSASLTFEQGSHDSVVVAIARTGGFVGAVSFALTGAPSGLASQFSPTSTTASSDTLSLVADANLPAQVYPLTIHATAAGLAEQTAPLAVTISAAPQPNVAIDFSACFPTKVEWVAYQDGTGPWTHVPQPGPIYRVNISSSKGGVAWVLSNAGSFPIDTVERVMLMTKAELTAGPIVACTSATPSGGSLTGSAGGIHAGQAASVTYGGAGAFFDYHFPSDSTFLMQNVPSGPQLLVAFRADSVTPANDRGVIRRNQDIPNGGTLRVNFDSTEGFPADTGSVAISGFVSGETFSFGVSYLSGPGCTPSPLFGSGFDLSATSSPQPFPEIPDSEQAAGEFNAVSVTTFKPGGQARTVQLSRHSLGSAAVALGAIPVVTAVSIAEPDTFRLVQASFTLPSDYHTSAQLGYAGGAFGIGEGIDMSVTASFGWLGQSDVVLAPPDFSHVDGWSANFNMPTGALNWGVTLTGTSGGPSLCSEGASIRTFGTSGSVN